MAHKNNLGRSLYYLVIATIALSPLYTLRFTLFESLPSTPLEVMILLTLGVWCLDRFLSRNFSIPRTKLDLPIITFFIAGTISILVNPDTLIAVGRWRAFILEPILMYYVIADVVKRDDAPDVKRFIVNSLTVTGVLLALLGIAQYLWQIGIVTPDQYNRAHGLYNSGNQLAMVLGPIILLNLVTFKKTLVHTLTLVTLLAAFFASQSLGGVLGLTGSILVLLVYRFTSKVIFHRLLSGGVIAVALLFMIFLTQISHFAPKVNNPWVRPGGTAQIRLCLWQGTYELLKDNPVFGSGLGGFSDLYQNYYTCDAEAFMEADNILLNFWTKTGLLGLVSILWFLVAIFKDRTNKLMYLIPFVYWVVHGMVDVPYFKNDLALLWWAFAAMYTSRE